MTKYIDAEKLSAQIEKLFPDSPDERIVEGFEYALDKVKATIDSLQQEQPEVDLEKEIHRYFNPHGMELQFDRSKGNTILKPEQLIDFASHFYELGLNARKK